MFFNEEFFIIYCILVSAGLIVVFCYCQQPEPVQYAITRSNAVTS